MWVYILFSKKLLKHYVGHTNNLNRRISEHNSGHSKFTNSGVPWKIITSFECKDRSEAVKLESQIKKRGIKRFLIDREIQD